MAPEQIKFSFLESNPEDAEAGKRKNKNKSQKHPKKSKPRSYDEDFEAQKISAEAQTGEKIGKIIPPETKEETRLRKEQIKKLFSEAKSKTGEEREKGRE